MRYAVYFTPPENHALTQSAADWLGRDAFSGAITPQAEAEAFSPARLAALTAEPRRYGFHATLKAPFELAVDKTEADLLEACADFCADTPPLTIPQVVVGRLGPFFALVPAELYQPLQDFAAAVVTEFEPFRAPLSDTDIARRNPEKLSERKRANLMRWGYPGVMEDFRFHMTLTGPVDDADAAPMRQLLDERFAKFHGQPLTVDGLGLFIEPERGAPFTVHSWLPLGGA